MYRFTTAMALLIASVAAASAQAGLPSIWQSQRGAIVKVFNIDRASGAFSGVFINGTSGACPGVNYNLTGRVLRPQRRVVFRTSNTWSSDCAVTTVWAGRALGSSSVATRWIATYRAPNGRLVRTSGTEVFRRI